MEDDTIDMMIPYNPVHAAELMHKHSVQKVTNIH